MAECVYIVSVYVCVLYVCQCVYTLGQGKKCYSKHEGPSSAGCMPVPRLQGGQRRDGPCSVLGCRAHGEVATFPFKLFPQN